MSKGVQGKKNECGKNKNASMVLWAGQETKKLEERLELLNCLED